LVAEKFEKKMLHTKLLSFGTW